MFTLTTLASGSSGNCALISGGGTHILVDAGISCRRIATALATLGLTPGDLAGILVTHEHTDHISGLKTLSKRHQVPIFTAPGTACALFEKIPETVPHVTTHPPGTRFSLGEVDIHTFPTFHDAAQPMGFALHFQGQKIAVVTDLGRITDHVVAGISGANLLLVEANHDEEWVRSGPYPYYLKDRVLGKFGHLSNESGGELARIAAESGTHTVILAHLSAENNTPQHAYDVVSTALLPWSSTVTLAVAPRGDVGPTYIA